MYRLGAVIIPEIRSSQHTIAASIGKLKVFDDLDERRHGLALSDTVSAMRKPRLLRDLNITQDRLYYVFR